MSTTDGDRKNLAKEFLQFAIEAELLAMGEFTTKSGRFSPYFFNTGKTDSGKSLRILASYYARAVRESGLEFDSIFGSAYKGIALALALALELGDEGTEIRFAFDRKEAKDHGEAGQLVGRLEGRVLVVDDVITSGLSLFAAAEHVAGAGAELAGVLVALDREERPEEDAGETAVERARRKLGVPVESIASANDLRDFLEQEGRADEAKLVGQQLDRYGAPPA